MDFEYARATLGGGTMDRAYANTAQSGLAANQTRKETEMERHLNAATALLSTAGSINERLSMLKDRFYGPAPECATDTACVEGGGGANSALSSTLQRLAAILSDVEQNAITLSRIA